MNWQPIDTAPTDQWVLVYIATDFRTPCLYQTGRSDGNGGWVSGLDGTTLLFPTHWMPLPAAPDSP